MMNMTRDRAPMAPGGLPYDLSIWVDKCTLVKLTLEVTTEFASTVSRGAHPSPPLDDYPPAMLLTLMAYSYATGVFPSSEIERRTYQDDMARYITANDHPNRDVLRAFRRRWRVVIRECLVNLFVLVWQHRCAAASHDDGGRDDYPTVERGPALSPETMRLCLCEADQRIDRAVQYDSMELDE